MDIFPNLQSLIISSSLAIYDDELFLILKSEQFKRLLSLKIKNEIVLKNNSYVVTILRMVLQEENTLHIFESLPEVYLSFSNVSNLKAGVNLRSLSLRLPMIQGVFSLLGYIPNLKYFNLGLTAILVPDQSHPTTDLSYIKLEKFSLVMHGNGVYRGNFPFLASFIKQFSSSLCCLSLNINNVYTDDLVFNGLTLQQQLLEPLIQLKSFHLYTLLDKKNQRM